MTAAEANAMLARETGWHFSYIEGLDEYTKRLLLGWKPKPPKAEREAAFQRQLQRLQTMGGQRGR